MGTVGNSFITPIWLRFLMDVELSKNYEKVAVLSAFGGPPPGNPLLDVLLPSLLYVRLASILDEALEVSIDINNLTLVKPYRDNFNGRICFLTEKRLLKDPLRLHAIRKRRNELAHETAAYDAAQPTACAWSELDDAVVGADSELQHLSLVGPRPTYRFHAGQETIGGGTNPPTMSNDHFFSLLLNGQTVFKVSWPAAGARIGPMRT